MDARTEAPFQPAPQQRVSVEIVGEVPPRFLCVDQPYFDAPPDQSLQHAEQRYGCRTLLDIKVFDVCRTDPQVVLYLPNTFDHLGIMGFILDVADHRGVF